MNFPARRPLPILFIALVAFALAACGDSTEGNDATTLAPTTEVGGDDGDTEPVTPPTEGASGGFAGDLSLAGQSMSLVSGCVDTFDPAGTGTITAQFIADDGTSVDVVVVADGQPTIGIVQEGRIWSNSTDAPFTVDLDADAGSATGRGSLVENRTTANPDADDTPVAVEFSATWDPANPCS